MNLIAFTDKQKGVLSRLIPYGVISSSLLFGADETETRNLRDVLERIEKTKLVSHGPLQKKGQYSSVKRDWLTKEGITAVIENMIPKSKQMLMENIEKISLRNGKSAENLSRLIRMSDAQTFLYSAGANTPYTTITQFGVNPFLFGNPWVDLSAKKEATFNDYAIKALLQYLDAEAAQGYPLPVIDKDFGLVLFLPNNCNPYAKVALASDRSKEGKDHKVMRSFNNSVGMLLDYINLNVYVIFKFLDRSKLTWRAKAYNSWFERCAATLREQGFKNLNYAGYPRDAIILCETPGEIANRAASCSKMINTFEHIFPIIMRQEGVEAVSTLLDLGRDKYITAFDSEALSQIPDAKPQDCLSGPYKLQYHGEPLYVGTMMDLNKLANAKNIITKLSGSIPYVACYEWQRQIYMENIAVPQERIIIIK